MLGFCKWKHAGGEKQKSRNWYRLCSICYKSQQSWYHMYNNSWGAWEDTTELCDCCEAAPKFNVYLRCKLCLISIGISNIFKRNRNLLPKAKINKKGKKWT